MLARRLLGPKLERSLICVLVNLFLVFLSSCNKDTPTEGTKTVQERDRTLNSLRKINNYPFYTMTYYGDYGFREYLNTGRWPDLSKLTSDKEGPNCTCFSVMGSDTSRLFCRNLDNSFHIALLLYTHPPDGYASVSMVYTPALGYSESNLPDSLDNRAALLNAPYLPVDGMNECGVAIGDMSVDHAEPPYNPSKITICQSTLIRLVLDYAANIEEAIRLIRGYNVHFEIRPQHFLISDVSGNSAIIEFLNNDMKVIRNIEKWLVSTNSVMYETQMPQVANFQYYDAISWSKWRYAKVYETLKKNEGNISTNEAMSLLSNVAASFGPPYSAFTLWSVVYNLKALELDIVIDRKYLVVYHFNLCEFKTD